MLSGSEENLKAESVSEISKDIVLAMDGMNAGGLSAWR
jgi:hypothetical protein